MAQTGRNIVKMDENTVRYNPSKMVGKAVDTGVQRRPALGELGNRAKNPNLVDALAGAKKNALGELPRQQSLKEIRPRVDTHWKKDVNQPAAGGVRPLMVRSDTNKLAGGIASRTALTNAAAIAAAAVGQQQPKLVRARTVQTAKPEQAQRVVMTRVRSEATGEQPPVARVRTTARDPTTTTSTTAAAITAAAAAITAQVRRQESNLTRRSLTKLRAAIQKDKQQKMHSGGGSTTSSSTESLAANAKAVRTKPTKKSSAIKTVAATVAVADVVAEAAAAAAPAVTMSAAEAVNAEPISHSASRMTDVENIDAADSGNLILVSEYVNDIYEYMHSLEQRYPIHSNYLHDQCEVTHKMRGVLVDWLNEVHMQFTLVQETFFMAVAIIDRYLQVVKTTSRQNLQLVGVTALFMASKYEELYPPEIRDFVYITDDTYDKKQILDMERHIFKTLEFNMGRPLPIHFLRRFAKAAHSGTFSDNVYLMSKYFIELAAVDYSMVHYLPSQVAGASLLLALRLMDTSDGSQSVWNKTIQHYTTYSEQQLDPIVQKMAQVVMDAPSSKLRAVYNKYKQPKLGQISTHPQLTATDALDHIVAGGSGGDSSA